MLSNRPTGEGKMNKRMCSMSFGVEVVVNRQKVLVKMLSYFSTAVRFFKQTQVY